MTENTKDLVALAHRALTLLPEHSGRKVRLVHISENATFVVSSNATDTHVLRIHRPNYHSKHAIRSELQWLEALREQTCVSVPQPTKGNGEDVHRVRCPEIPQGRWCVFFAFCSGQPPKPQQQAELFPILGEITAHMHRHSLQWRPPSGFVRPHWDEETILGKRPIWGSWHRGPALNSERTDLLSRAEQVLRVRLAAFGKGKHRFGLIHADLHSANLLLQNQHVHLIDFDDCGFSWYLHDLATALSFQEDKPQTPNLIAAWMDGYRRVRPLPQAEENAIPNFLMLRRLQILAWIGSRANTELAKSLGPAYTQGTCNLAETYLRRFG